MGQNTSCCYKEKRRSKSLSSFHKTSSEENRINVNYTTPEKATFEECNNNLIKSLFEI